MTHTCVTRNQWFHISIYNVQISASVYHHLQTLYIYIYIYISLKVNDSDDEYETNHNISDGWKNSWSCVIIIEIGVKSITHPHPCEMPGYVALQNKHTFGSGSLQNITLCLFYVNFSKTLHDVIMGSMASQITSLTIVYSAVYSGADQRRHQGSASLAFVRGIHRGPVNSPHKWPVTRKMFPFDDVIMTSEASTLIEIEKNNIAPSRHG